MSDREGSVMRSEILEQPAVVHETLIRSAEALSVLGGRLTERDTVALLGRGSSKSAATYGAGVLQTIANVPAFVMSPSSLVVEDRYRDLPWSRILVIAISQSGESLEILESLERLPPSAEVLGITNDTDSSLSRLLGEHALLRLRSGEERAIPATKTFTSTLACLLAVANAMGQQEDMTQQAADALPGLMRDVLEEDSAFDLSARTAMILAGEDLQLGIAEEGAIKLRETLRMIVSAFETSELLHGNINSAKPGTGVITLATDETSRALARTARDAATARGAIAYAIGPCAEPDVTSITVPSCRSEWAPFLSVLPLQRSAWASAMRLGCDPDAPTRLSKVTRVFGVSRRAFDRS